MLKQVSFFFVFLLIMSCGNDDREAVSISDHNTELTFDNIAFLIFDTPTNSTTFGYGERLNIEISNLNGFDLENNTLRPGVSFAIHGPDGTVIQKADDLYNGQSIELADQTFDPSFYVDMLHPIIPGAGYSLKLNMWDKSSGRSIPINKSFEVQKPVKNGFLSESAGGIEPNILVVFKNGRPYTGNTFSIGDKIHIHMVLDQDFLSRALPFSATVSAMKGEAEIFKRSESGTFSTDTGPLNSYIVLQEEDYISGQVYTIHFDMSIYGSSENYSIRFPIEIVENAD